MDRGLWGRKNPDVMMKAKPFKYWKTEDGHGWTPCEPDEATHVELNIPGPQGCSMLPVNEVPLPFTTPRWKWNKDMEKPTIDPSIRTEARGRWVCHSVITDGVVHFCTDSTPEFSGKSVPLLNVED